MADKIIETRYAKLALLPKVEGIDVDGSTRCRHYHSPLDIVAMKFRCCGQYFACLDCHRETTNHVVNRWPRAEFHVKAILCGACRSELTIEEYLTGESKCPKCGATFNPGCQNHWHHYFEI